MFRLQILLLGVLFVLVRVSAETHLPTIPDNDAVEYDGFIAYEANPVKDVFDWRLLQKFTSAKGYNNVILSPISLKLVLALLYEGSAGLTDKEFRRVLNFPENKTIIRQQFSEVLDALIMKRNNQYILNIGTTLFLDSGLTPSPTYQTIAQTFYHTDLAKTNFSNPKEASVSINSWVEYVTNARIKAFVQPDDVEDAVMVAANAIYFKGMWSIPFQKNETFTGGFYASGSRVVDVQYMKLTEKFYYFDSKSLGAEILRIPYKGGKFALYIVLPHSRGGLPYLIEDLDLVNLAMSVKLMDTRPVQLILPKFRFDFQARYSQILREFGFETLFTGVASFPGIVRDQEAQLVVTDILQKSGIDVNEEGSIIYTTTQVTIGNKFGGESVVVFNVSKPFLFFVQEEVTKDIVFIGKIENPLEVEGVPLPPRYAVDPPVVPLSNPAQYPSPQLPVESLGSQFDIDLLKNSIGTSKNIFLSPSTVKVSLGMLAEAASGATAEEIYSALHISPHQKDRLVESLIRELTEIQPSSILELQNALFVSDRTRIKPQYRSIAKRYYRAMVKELNFQDGVKSASVINDFVKNATRGLISQIISSDEINQDTQIILTNALYFKATWETFFDKKWTRAACFHTPRGCVDVPLMQMIDTFGYGQTQHAQIVQLNYAGGTRALLLVVPKKHDGLQAALRDLQDYRSFGDLIRSLNESEVELLLPRFEIDYSFNLVHTLHKMGIRRIFAANSELSNLFDGGQLGLVDSFIHKAKVEVNEEGTKASAVSLVSVIPLMGITTPKVRADHPFAFFIFNTHTNTILFEGILNEPVPENHHTANRNAIMYPQAVQRNQLPTQHV